MLNIIHEHTQTDKTIDNLQKETELMSTITNNMKFCISTNNEIISTLTL